MDRTNNVTSTEVPAAEVLARRFNGGPQPDSGGNALSLEQMLYALETMRAGDFSVRLPGHHTGLPGKIADTFNQIATANERMADELAHVGQIVGREGKTRTRVRLDMSSGAWREMESSINTLIDDLLWPTAAVTQVITAVAQGDLL